MHEGLLTSGLLGVLVRLVYLDLLRGGTRVKCFTSIPGSVVRRSKSDPRSIEIASRQVPEVLLHENGTTGGNAEPGAGPSR